MSQCVPNWELDDPPSNANPSQLLHLNTPSAGTAAAAAAATRSDYEVAELTWVNGHPSMHGLGQFRIGKPVPKYPSHATWDKILTGGGTLESVVDQATGAVPLSAATGTPTASDYDLVPWLTNASGNHRRGGGGYSTATTTSASGAAVMDALVPCSNRAAMLVDDHSTRVPEPSAAGGTGHGVVGRKRSRAAGDGNCSVSGSAASMGIQFDTCDVTGGDDVCFATSTSPIDGSPETGNTSCGRPLTAVDEHDSASHSHRSQRDGGGGCEQEERKKGVGRSSISTKRSRAAAVHNQSERKRRDRINQRMKTLQKLVPNSSKTDKASMLDEVIDYLKQLQAQVQMMSRMNSIPHMMMPMPMPMPMQQLQMAMMAQMSQMAQMGMAGMGMAMPMMDMNSLARPQPQHQPQPQPHPQPGMPPPPPPPVMHPPAFFPFAGPSWDSAGDRAPADPFSAFMACQAQNPMNINAFSRFAAMYQQMYQQPQQPNSNPGDSNTTNPITK